MRPKDPQELAKLLSPSVRTTSKRGDMYVELREQIILGQIKPGTELVPSAIAKEFNTNNQAAQLNLYRLACEGLVEIRPRHATQWPFNNVLNEYIVRGVVRKPLFLSSRQGGFIDEAQALGFAPEEIPVEVTMVRADEELANLLECPANDAVVFRRTIQRLNNVPNLGSLVVAISDSYLPSRFFRIMPDLHQPNVNLYGMIESEFGEAATTLEETIYADFADAEARQIFGLSVDSPTPLLRVYRRILNAEGRPIESCWISDRGDIYGLSYRQPFRFERQG